MIRDEKNRAREPTTVAIETIAIRSPAVATPAIIDTYNYENNREACKKKCGDVTVLDFVCGGKDFWF